MSAKPIAIAIALAFVSPSISAKAVALKPDSDDAVVATLPPAQRQAAVRNAIAARVANEAAHDRIERARTLLDSGRQQNDIRLVEMAARMLSQNRFDTDTAALRLRAAAFSWRHEFDNARQALMSATRLDPDDARTWLALANVERVQGALEAATRACEKAHALSPSAVTALCLADLASLRGQHELTSQWLTHAGEQTTFNDDTAGWRALTRARIAVRQGDDRGARLAYANALLVADDSVLSSYARWALEQGEADRVARLLEATQTRRAATLADDLAVSLAIAWQQSGESGRARSLAARLEKRFQIAESHGLPMHWGARARQVLAFSNDHDKALEYAWRNWHVQRETDDARVLARAALAAKHAQTLASLRDFVAHTGLEDTVLNELLATSVAS